VKTKAQNGSIIFSRPHSYCMLDLSMHSDGPLEEETEVEGGEVNFLGTYI
jgi:hypothetical protein